MILLLLLLLLLVCAPPGSGDGRTAINNIIIMDSDVTRIYLTKRANLYRGRTLIADNYFIYTPKIIHVCVKSAAHPNRPICI